MYLLSNLCKILDIFVNEIFHISIMKFFSIFEIKNILPFRFAYAGKKHSSSIYWGDVFKLAAYVQQPIRLFHSMNTEW